MTKDNQTNIDSSASFYHHAIATSVAIAVTAGEAIIEIYSTGTTAVEQKADNSPLTEADMRSHRIITEELKQAFPDIPVLSEEGKDIPFHERQSWTRYWLVDPLDGTKEFIKRNGEFTVNIALVEEQKPILGVVAVPARDRLYFGGVFSDGAGIRAPESKAPEDGAPDVPESGNGNPSLHSGSGTFGAYIITGYRSAGLCDRTDVQSLLSKAKKITVSGEFGQTPSSSQSDSLSVPGFDPAGSGDSIPPTSRARAGFSAETSPSTSTHASQGEKTLRVVASRSHFSKETEEYIEQLSKSVQGAGNLPGPENALRRGSAHAVETPATAHAAGNAPETKSAAGHADAERPTGVSGAGSTTGHGVGNDIHDSAGPSTTDHTPADQPAPGRGADRTTLHGAHSSPGSIDEKQPVPEAAAPATTPSRSENPFPNIELVQAGSSVKFCLVAEGKADVYPRFGPTMEWDTAAGQAVAEAAGAQVVLAEDETKPLVYNKRNLLNPWFIVKAE